MAPEFCLRNHPASAVAPGCRAGSDRLACHGTGTSRTAGRMGELLEGAIEAEPLNAFAVANG